MNSAAQGLCSIRDGRRPGKRSSRRVTPDRSMMSFAAMPCRRHRAGTTSAHMPSPNPYEFELERNQANYTPLTPLTLIARTAYTYPTQLAVVHGDRRYTWAESYARCRRLASALANAGIGFGDTVAVVASNTPEM